MIVPKSFEMDRLFESYAVERTFVVNFSLVDSREVSFENANFSES